MFCSKCGTEIGDGSVFCHECGEIVCQNDSKDYDTVPSSPDNVETNGNDEYLSGIHKKKRKFYTIGTVLMLMIVIIVGVVITVLSNASYKKPINNFEKLLNERESNYFTHIEEYNTPEYENKYNLVFSEVWCDFYGLDEYYEERYSEFFSNMETRFGQYSVSIDIVEKDKLNNEELENIAEERRENLLQRYSVANEEELQEIIDGREEYYDEVVNDEGDTLSDSQAKKMLQAEKSYIQGTLNEKITAGYEVDLKVIIKGDNDSEDLYLEDVQILKVNGEWIAYNLGPFYLGLVFD